MHRKGKPRWPHCSLIDQSLFKSSSRVEALRAQEQRALARHGDFEMGMAEGMRCRCMTLLVLVGVAARAVSAVTDGETSQIGARIRYVSIAGIPRE